MKKCLVCSVFITVAALSYAGAAGLVIKGVSHSWDEIAKLALKVSGRELTDDAVKSAVKTIEQAAEKYGDDVAKASVKGGVEVAEQTMKRGGRFFGVLQKAAQYSDESLRALALNADDIVKYSAKYGDDVIVKLNAKVPGQVSRMVAATEKSGIGGVERAMRAVSDLPSEDIPRVLGAIEKNPSVAREFIEHVEKGGKYFVDKVFEVNAKQIMAGGLSVSMIGAAFRATAPLAATAVQIEKGPPIDGGGIVDGMKCGMIILALCVGVGLIVYVVRKTRLAKEWIKKDNMMNEKLKRSIVRWIGLILIVAPFIWNAWFPFEDGYWLMDFLITIAGIFLIVATIAEPFEIIGCIMIAIGWFSVVLYILNAHKALTFSVLLIVSGGIVPDLPRIISRFKKRKSFPRKVATACGPSHAITSPDLPIVTKALPVTAPCPGTVLRWTVADGQLVSKGDEILVMDVMKMETPINAPCAGIVSLKVAATDHVHTGDMMALILINSCVAAPCCGLSTKQDAQPEQEKTRNNSKTASKVIGKVPLLVDGNNVVRQSQRYGWRVLKTLLDWLNANNVDHFLYFDASIRYVMKEEMDETGRAFIDAQLQDEGRVTICPARDEADKFILSRANKEGNHIISDDGYRQWEAQYPWINAMNETGNRRVHKFSVEGDVLSVPDLDIREKIMDS